MVRLQHVSRFSVNLLFLRCIRSDVDDAAHGVAAMFSGERTADDIDLFGFAG